MGLGAGACLILALAFISLRTADHRQAASLSVMAQSVGYLVAAAGPVGFGFLHDVAGDWRAPLAVLGTVGVLQAIAGFGAGRDHAPI